MIYIYDLFGVAFACQRAERAHDQIEKFQNFKSFTHVAVPSNSPHKSQNNRQIPLTNLQNHKTTDKTNTVAAAKTHNTSLPHEEASYINR